MAYEKQEVEEQEEEKAQAAAMISLRERQISPSQGSIDLFASQVNFFIFLLKIEKLCVEIFFLTFPVGFSIPIIFSNLNYNFSSNVLDPRNLQEQVKKPFCFKNCTDTKYHLYIYNFFFN